MYGVILWSDHKDGKAVIWCEDAGNLAYYEAPTDRVHLEAGHFDAGDYVEFDVINERHLRRASNAHRVVSSDIVSTPSANGDLGVDAPEPETGPHAQVIRLSNTAMRTG